MEELPLSLYLAAFQTKINREFKNSCQIHIMNNNYKKLHMNFKNVLQQNHLTLLPLATNFLSNPLHTHNISNMSKQLFRSK